MRRCCAEYQPTFHINHVSCDVCTCTVTSRYKAHFIVFTRFIKHKVWSWTGFWMGFSRYFTQSGFFGCFNILRAQTGLRQTQSLSRCFLQPFLLLQTTTTMSETIPIGGDSLNSNPRKQKRKSFSDIQKLELVKEYENTNFVSIW